MRNYYSTDINALEEEIQSKRDFKNAISVNTRRIDCTMSGLSENEYSGADADAIREGMSVMVKETFPRQMDLVDVTISMLEDLRDGYCECKKFGDEIGTIFDVGDLYTPSGKVICDIEKIEALRSFCDEIFAGQHEMLDALQVAKSNLESVDNPKWELIAKAEDVISALNKLDVFDDYRILVGKYAEKVVNMDDIAVARIREIIPTRAHNYVQKPARIKQKLSKSKVQGLLDVKTSSGRLKDIKGLSGTKGGFSGLKGLGGGSYRMQTLYGAVPNSRIHTVAYTGEKYRSSVDYSKVWAQEYLFRLLWKDELTEEEQAELAYYWYYFLQVDDELMADMAAQFLKRFRLEQRSILNDKCLEFLATLWVEGINCKNQRLMQNVIDIAAYVNLTNVCTAMLGYIPPFAEGEAYYSLVILKNNTIPTGHIVKVYEENGRWNFGEAKDDNSELNHIASFVNMNELATREGIENLNNLGYSTTDIVSMFSCIANDSDAAFIAELAKINTYDWASYYNLFNSDDRGYARAELTDAFIGAALADYEYRLVDFDGLSTSRLENFINGLLMVEREEDSSNQIDYRLKFANMINQGSIAQRESSAMTAGFIPCYDNNRIFENWQFLDGLNTSITFFLSEMDSRYRQIDFEDDICRPINCSLYIKGLERKINDDNNEYYYMEYGITHHTNGHDYKEELTLQTDYSDDEWERYENRLEWEQIKEENSWSNLLGKFIWSVALDHFIGHFEQLNNLSKLEEYIITTGEVAIALDEAIGNGNMATIKLDETASSEIYKLYGYRCVAVYKGDNGFFSQVYDSTKNVYAVEVVKGHYSPQFYYMESIIEMYGTRSWDNGLFIYGESDDDILDFEKMLMEKYDDDRIIELYKGLYCGDISYMEFLEDCRYGKDGYEWNDYDYYMSEYNDLFHNKNYISDFYNNASREYGDLCLQN